jgi:hypothetical protein
MNLLGENTVRLRVEINGLQNKCAVIISRSWHILLISAHHKEITPLVYFLHGNRKARQKPSIPWQGSSPLQ